MTDTMRLRTGTPDGAEVAVVEVDRRQIVRFSVSDANRLEPLSVSATESLAAACDLAHTKRLPLVVWISSSGANVHEGIAAVDGWGRAAHAMVGCSGVVPIILVLHGPAVSGSALLLGVADHVVMVDESVAFVSGPRMVEQYTGVPVEQTTLGGTATHTRESGVASLIAASAAEADELVDALLAHLPDHNDQLPGRHESTDPTDSPIAELRDIVPVTATGSYDVRQVLDLIVDSPGILELRAGWAPSLVTAFATIDGRPVGIVANQPQALAGTLNIEASQKGARFVSFCDAFNISLLTLVDTPGFQPGKDLEWRGMIRHGAELAFAYARATVPRVSVTIRKSYGGAYIVMDSKEMGNDIAYAWPLAEIAVMGAKGAVEILHRRADAEERAEREVEYEERLLNPWRAAERGSIDAVIDPADTRRHVAHALALLESKTEGLVARRHGNTPL